MVPRGRADARDLPGPQPLRGRRRVVDAAGLELADRHEGRLQFRGPSATPGYFRNPEATRKLIDGEWLNTGDRAYLADGTLFITSSIPAGIGINSADWPQPQQFDSDMGKVLRINADGSIPQDNPFAGRSNTRPEIYALGLRDVQGVAIHPRTGQVWVSEHGPRGGDEINAISKGGNYGFPIIGYGRDYSGKPINGDKTAQDGMEQPVYFWTPDIAPAGIAFYTGARFPAWQGDLFVSALAGKSLVR